MKRDTLIYSLLFCFADLASANVLWPDRPGTNYNADFDFKVSGTGSIKSAFIHAMYNTEVDGTYIGAQTDSKGDGSKVVFTVFIGKDNFSKRRYSHPKSAGNLKCEGDDHPAESRGHVSCIMDFAWSKNTWYRMRVWATGESKDANGLPLRNWTAWVIELDANGSTKKETQIATIGAPPGWLKGARYSSVENFAHHGPDRCAVYKSDWGNAVVEIGYPYYNNRSTWSQDPSAGQSVDGLCKPKTSVDSKGLKLKVEY